MNKKVRDRQLDSEVSKFNSSEFWKTKTQLTGNRGERKILPKLEKDANLHIKSFMQYLTR